MGLSFNLVISRVGTIVGPFILLLGPYNPLVFGIGALISGLLALLLPETLGTSLPDTIVDGERVSLALPCLGNKEATLPAAEANQYQLEDAQSVVT